MKFLLFVSVCLQSIVTAVEYLNEPKLILTSPSEISMVKAYENNIYYAINETIFQYSIDTKESKSNQLDGDILDIQPWNSYLWAISNQTLYQIRQSDFSIINTWQMKIDEMFVTDGNVYWLKNGKIGYMCSYDCSDPSVQQFIPEPDLNDNFTHISVFEYENNGFIDLSMNQSIYSTFQNYRHLFQHPEYPEVIKQLYMDSIYTTLYVMTNKYIFPFGGGAYFQLYPLQLQNETFTRIEYHHPYLYYLVSNGTVGQWNPQYTFPSTLIQMDDSDITSFSVYNYDLYTLSHNGTIIYYWHLPNPLDDSFWFKYFRLKPKDYYKYGTLIIVAAGMSVPVTLLFCYCCVYRRFLGQQQKNNNRQPVEEIQQSASINRNSMESLPEYDVGYPQPPPYSRY